MAATRLLQMVETKKKLDEIGVELVDMTSGPFGRMYASLQHPDEYGHLISYDNYCQHPNGYHKHTDDIVINKPEFGTLSQPSIEALTAASRQSQFGRGGETVTDTAVRDSIEVLVTEEMSVNNELVKSAHRVAGRLFGFGNIQAVVPDKIVLYVAGGHFDRHRDTAYATNHVGTVVALLGSRDSYTGGALGFPFVSGDKHPRRIDSPSSIVAFYADLPHEVEPVIKGHRVVITFRVFLKQLIPQADISASELDGDSAYYDKDNHGMCVEQIHERKFKEPHGTAEQAFEVFGANRLGLPKFADSPFVTELRKLAANQGVVLGCMHLIPADAYAQGIKGLRGFDAYLATKLQQLGFDVRVVLVFVHYEGAYDDRDTNEITRTVRAMSDDPDIEKMLESAVFARPCIGISDVIDHSPYVEYTGNESAPVDMRYVCTGMLVSL